MVPRNSLVLSPLLAELFCPLSPHSSIIRLPLPSSVRHSVPSPLTCVGSSLTHLWTILSWLSISAPTLFFSRSLKSSLFCTAFTATSSPLCRAIIKTHHQKHKTGIVRIKKKNRQYSANQVCAWASTVVPKCTPYTYRIKRKRTPPPRDEFRSCFSPQRAE